MQITDPRDALMIAHEHARRLRSTKGADRVRPASAAHRTLASWLRHAADLLDPAPLARRAT
jgi:hypothetical protein